QRHPGDLGQDAAVHADQAADARPDRDVRVLVQLLPVRIQRERRPPGRHPGADPARGQLGEGSATVKTFRERNPVTAGVVGLTVIGLLMLAVFKAQALPLIGGGTRYSAQFTEAAGLKPNDEVRVAGVRVGQVEKVELDGDHVKVTFRVQDVRGVRLGDETRAETKIKTLLGAKFLMLIPEGSGRLKAGTEIPLDRTVSPYDVIDAFSDLATPTERIDTAQLAKAFDTLSATFRNTPEEVQASLTGLSRLS